MMVTLTGTFTRLDGTPATGTVRVTPSRSPIMDPQGRIVISGPQTFPLDGDGKLAFQIPASNDPDLGPAFTYTVEALLSHKPWKISKVWIPHGSTTVDLSDIADYEPTPGVATRVVTIPADGADGQVLVWDGAGFSWDFPPKGDKGDKGDPGIVVDTSVGTRVMANGVMIYGDTGWRDMREYLTPGILEPAGSGAHQSFRMQRVNSTVNFQMWLKVGEELAGSNTNSRTGFLEGLPTGFTQNPAAYSSLAEYTNHSTGLVTAISNTGLASKLDIYRTGDTQWALGETIFLYGIYQTRHPWPTVLPGLPA